MKSAFSVSLSLGSELVSEVRGFRDRGSSVGLGCGFPEPERGVKGAEFSRDEGGASEDFRRTGGRSDSGLLLPPRPAFGEVSADRPDGARSVCERGG